MQCEWCEKTLSTKYGLKNHQKKTKSCIEIQKSKNVYEESDEFSKFDCAFCEKKFTSQSSRELHESKCVVRHYQDKIELHYTMKMEILKSEYKSLISNLQIQLQKVERNNRRLEIELSKSKANHLEWLEKTLNAFTNVTNVSVSRKQIVTL